MKLAIIAMTAAAMTTPLAATAGEGPLPLCCQEGEPGAKCTLMSEVPGQSYHLALGGQKGYWTSKYVQTLTAGHTYWVCGEMGIQALGVDFEDADGNFIEWLAEKSFGGIAPIKERCIDFTPTHGGKGRLVFYSHTGGAFGDLILKW
jgi:hypothetical protein